MRKLRHREAKLCAQVRTASERQAGRLSPACWCQSLPLSTGVLWQVRIYLLIHPFFPSLTLATQSIYSVFLILTQEILYTVELTNIQWLSPFLWKSFYFLELRFLWTSQSSLSLLTSCTTLQTAHHLFDPFLSWAPLPTPGPGFPAASSPLPGSIARLLHPTPLSFLI